MDKSQKDVCAEAISHYGEQHQMIKAVEELSELQKEICKFLGYSMNGTLVNNPDLRDKCIGLISSEMADVEVVMEQLKMIFHNNQMVESIVAGKVARLKVRMGG